MIENIEQYNPEREQFGKIADELDAMQKRIAAEQGRDGGSISHVEYIVSDLRKGDLAMARRDYESQSDKFGGLEEIVRFLEKNGVAEKIDFAKFK